MFCACIRIHRVLAQAIPASLHVLLQGSWVLTCVGLVAHLTFFGPPGIQEYMTLPRAVQKGNMFSTAADPTDANMSCGS